MWPPRLRKSSTDSRSASGGRRPALIEVAGFALAATGAGDLFVAFVAFGGGSGVAGSRFATCLAAAAFIAAPRCAQRTLDAFGDGARRNGWVRLLGGAFVGHADHHDRHFGLLGSRYRMSTAEHLPGPATVDAKSPLEHRQRAIPRVVAGINCAQLLAPRVGRPQPLQFIDDATPTIGLDHIAVDRRIVFEHA